MRSELDLDRRPASGPAAGFELHANQDQAPAPTPPGPPAASSRRGWTALLEACTADLKAAMEASDAAGIPPLVKAVAEFALIERGAIRPGSRRAQQALRVGRLSLARRLVTRHLAEPALSPTMIADMLGVSVRYLHVLFETTGKSFSHTVTDQRLAESRRLLCAAPPRPIAEIAFACGFGSLATFYRIFTAREGVTPGEFRARSGGTDVHGRPPSDASAGVSHLTGK